MKAKKGGEEGKGKDEERVRLNKMEALQYKSRSGNRN